jgi:hypothetical protein
MLARANKERRFEQLFAKLDYTRSEPLFFQVYLALREVEVRGLRLLGEVAILKQMLEHEQLARDQAKELGRMFQEQERGNGKRTVIIDPDDLQEQEKLVNKHRKRAQEATVQLAEIFLAQHRTLILAGTSFKALDASFVLVDPTTDKRILKLYGQIGGTEALLLKRLQDEVDGAKPLALARDLEGARRHLRQQLTALSTARRHFAAFIQQYIPVAGV